LGRRTQRSPSAGIATNFVYDGQDVVRDLNSDGSTVDYLNGLGIDNKLRLTDSRLIATGPLYFSQDHLGSTVTLTNSLGATVSQVNYDSFGNSAGNSFTRYDYTGRERDGDTGLMYYRARWYDPKVGRFISEDPAGLSGGLNLYGYVGGDPVNMVDPQGLWGSVGLWKIHQAITRRALSGQGPSGSDLKTLIEEQYFFDQTTQGEQYAYMHAMRMRGERPEDSRRKANQFVRCRICKAQKLAKEGKRTAAMQALSQAMHTVQDAASPAHANFAEAWQDTTWQTINHLPHYVSENFDPGPGSVSDESTLRIWRYFTGESPMPDDFFPGEFDLNKYGRGYFTNRPAPDHFSCDCCPN
jgi:RHS repeat-associated protein